MALRPSWVLSAALLLSAFPAGPAQAWLWVQDDWAGGHFSAAVDVEAEAAPGELVLACDPDRLVPAFDATDAYQGVWSLVPYQGRLHMAACTTPMADTGGDLLSYDPAAHAVTLDYSVYEEGNIVLREEGGLLMSPGLDNLGSWEWGNLYLNDGSGWLRKETVPAALHVHDVAMHEGRLYVTTGEGPPDFQAAVFVSDDLGDSWTEVFAVLPHPPENYFRRFYGLASWGGALWVQSDFWWPEGKVIYELRDGDATAHTVPAGAYTLCGFASYAGRLLCLTGTLLDSWDGSLWRGLLLPQPSHNFGTRALCVDRDRVYVGGFEGASWTDDLATWHPLTIDEFGGKEVEAFAAFHGRLYAGTYGAGEVYVSPAAPEGTLTSEAFCAPAPFGRGPAGLDGDPAGHNRHRLPAALSRQRGAPAHGALARPGRHGGELVHGVRQRAGPSPRRPVVAAVARPPDERRSRPEPDPRAGGRAARAGRGHRGAAAAGGGCPARLAESLHERAATGRAGAGRRRLCQSTMPRVACSAVCRRRRRAPPGTAATARAARCRAVSI